jgi:molybdenum cofactor guanylyltransferase
VWAQNQTDSADVLPEHSALRRSYDRAVAAISAFVLAGGRSTRMGRDKAFLDLGGRSVVERMLALARSVSEDVAIVGEPAKFASFAPVVPDIYSDHGPLGGIHAALSRSIAQLNLMLAVDLPFVNSGFLDYLISRAEESGAVVTVPFVASRYQPLCAVYRRTFAAVAEAALAAGKNKIDALFSQVPLRVINDEELSQAGFNAGMFRNVNTPEEWGQAKHELESQAQHL